MDQGFDFLHYLLFGAVVFLVYKLYELNKMVEELDEESSDILDMFYDKVIYSKLEVVGGRLMMYKEETGEFLAQGNNWKELNDNLTTNFPNKWFHLEQEVIDKARKLNEGDYDEQSTNSKIG